MTTTFFRSSEISAETQRTVVSHRDIQIRVRGLLSCSGHSKAGCPGNG